MLQTFWERGELGIDLTQTLLPAAREIADWTSPYPRIRLPAARRIRPRTVDLGAVAGARLDRGAPARYSPASLWVLRVRDWRCYGAAFLWGASFHAVQTGNVTIPLLLFTALAWRARDSLRRRSLERPRGRDEDHLLAARRLARVDTAAQRPRSTSIAVAGGVTIRPLGPARVLRACSSTRRASTSSKTRRPARATRCGRSSRTSARRSLGQLAWYLLVASRARRVRRRRTPRRRPPLLRASRCSACVIASPIVWLHSFVLLLAPVALYRPRFGDRLGDPGPPLVRLRVGQRRALADRARAGRRGADVRPRNCGPETGTGLSFRRCSR